jgi:hypothetical protein
MPVLVSFSSHYCRVIIVELTRRLTHDMTATSTTWVVRPSSLGTLPSCYSFIICYDWASLSSLAGHRFEPSSLLSLTDLLNRSLTHTHTIGASTPLTDIELSFDHNIATTRGQLMNNIGYIYLHGLFGTPADPIKAVEWFKKSALLDDEFGCFNYGWMLRDGVSKTQPNKRFIPLTIMMMLLTIMVTLLLQ